MTSVKTYNVNGFDFRIGFQADKEFSGPVFEIVKDGKRYGVMTTTAENREMGFNQGAEASDEELSAISEARKILYTNHWNSNGHFWHE